ncbi:hypothetical protein CCHR01_15272 [Colletotrichum chrysophilum]|uniref:Uncharacterized protein n=1 Tax=Colletotrichum chrysophilum TaxID=1836956 RepID=A0AAD9A7Z6_9PEZI|nr:hypothetical protein CCHR01_15272 [Colletotrichum chrysophilum]
MGVKVILSCGLVPGRVLCCPSNVRVVFGTGRCSLSGLGSSLSVCTAFPSSPLAAYATSSPTQA